MTDFVVLGGLEGHSCYEIGRRATGGGSETDERDRGAQVAAGTQGLSWGLIPI